MPENTAAWAPALHATHFDVKPAPYTKPSGKELVVKACAVAVNPIDWILPDKANVAFPWIKFPFVFGSDVAGRVVEVGPNVERFRTGDRIVGHACGVSKIKNSPAKCAFQNYVVLEEHMTSGIPDSLTFESAAVLPLGLSTAACGLFQEQSLNLRRPVLEPKATTETLIIWGGSTSVGCNAIQLAVAAGYSVYATCSPKNFEHVQRLGAARVFDYNSMTVVADITKAFEGRECAGALIMGQGGAEACLDILPKLRGRRTIAMATFPLDQQAGILTTMFQMIYWAIRTYPKVWMRRVTLKFIVGDALDGTELGPYIYDTFLPTALAAGRYEAAPAPQVVGQGLEYVEEALALQKKGVSMKKLVVSL